jgi:hypothetical protein
VKATLSLFAMPANSNSRAALLAGVTASVRSRLPSNAMMPGPSPGASFDPPLIRHISDDRTVALERLTIR